MPHASDREEAVIRLLKSIDSCLGYLLSTLFRNAALSPYIFLQARPLVVPYIYIPGQKKRI
jgi:hypothetical protein